MKCLGFHSIAFFRRSGNRWSQGKWESAEVVCLQGLPCRYMYSFRKKFFPFIKNLHSDKDSAYAKYMGDAIFKVPTPLMLSKVVDRLDDIFDDISKSGNTDVRGDVYEYLLNKIAQSGVNGQFRTPRHIIRMMVDLMEPESDDIICDPACGIRLPDLLRGILERKQEKEIFYDKKIKSIT